MQDTLRYGLMTSSKILHDKVVSVIRTYKYPVDVRLINTETVLETATELYHNGVNAFIVGPALADVLMKSFDIPILNIPLSLDDILLSIDEAKAYDRKILLAMPGDKMQSIDIVEEMMGIQVIQKTYRTFDELEQVLKKWHRDGNKVVVAGGPAVRLCKKLGLIHVTYRRSTESIITLLENAEQVVKKFVESSNMFERYQSILNSSNEGFITINEEQVIIIYNKFAESVLGKPRADVVGKDIRTLFDDREILQGIRHHEKTNNLIKKIDNSSYLFRFFPVYSGRRNIGLTINIRELSSLVSDVQQAQRTLTRRLTAKFSIDDLVYQSPQMAAIVDKVRNFSPSESSILISGDSGTGKEIIAHSIHSLSGHRKGPFVSINCASIPEQLLESELFGHEEGAFTGARRGGKAGLFELAHNGTLFLDEVNSLPLSLQGKLLRAIESREIMRVGGDSIISVAVRIIAAANRDMAREVLSGSFREDLFYRLNILTITIPPLKERLEDIPLLTEMLLQRLSRSLGRRAPRIPASCMARLKELQWKGNVRQLSAFLERLLLLSGEGFDPGVFDRLFTEEKTFSLETGVAAGPRREESSLPENFETIRIQVRRNESDAILAALQEAYWNKTAAAKKLGISRATLHRKLKAMQQSHEAG